MTDPKLTIRTTETVRDSFKALQGKETASECLAKLIEFYETHKNDAVQGDVVALDDKPKEFFSGGRVTEKKNRESVKTLTERDSLVMTEKEFLEMVSEYTGMTPNELVSKGIQSYAQTLMVKIANGSHGALGGADDEITQTVLDLCETVRLGNDPKFNAVTLTKIQYRTYKSYTTIKGWAERKGVLEMIKNSDNCVTVDGLDEFIAKIS